MSEIISTVIIILLPVSSHEAESQNTGLLTSSRSMTNIKTSFCPFQPPSHVLLLLRGNLRATDEGKIINQSNRQPSTPVSSDFKKVSGRMQTK